VSKDYFNPEGQVTKAQFVALLVRTLNLKSNNVSASFKDVVKSDWYYDDITTAYLYGIAVGDGQGNFHPNKNISREEMATLLVRALEKSGKYIVTDQNAMLQVLNQFKDSKDISDWAKSYVAGAVKLNIMKGRSNGVFAPKAVSTRAESAKVIKAVYDIVSE